MANEMLPHDIPQCYHDHRPTNIMGDGNGLTRSTSLSASGHATGPEETHCMIMVDIALTDDYLDINSVNRVISRPLRRCTGPCYRLHNEHMVIWQLFALSCHVTYTPCNLLDQECNDWCWTVWSHLGHRDTQSRKFELCGHLQGPAN